MRKILKDYGEMRSGCRYLERSMALARRFVGTGELLLKSCMHRNVANQERLEIRRGRQHNSSYCVYYLTGGGGVGDFMLT